MKRQDTHSSKTRTQSIKHVAHAPTKAARTVGRSSRKSIGRSPRDVDAALGKPKADPLASLADLQKYTAMYPGRFADDVAASAFTDSAIAIGPGADASALSALALGGNANAGSNATALGTVASATGSNSTAVGAQANASGPSALAFGAGANASGNSATAVGQSAMASGAATTAFGQGATATGIYSFALGIGTQALGSNTVAIGAGSISNTGSNTDGDGNIVIGSGALVNGTGAGAVVLGRGAYIAGGGADAGAGAVVLGDGASASANNAVAIGANAMANVANTFSVGRAGSERVLVHVAPGDISSTTSTDAINGGQLFDARQLVTDLRDSLQTGGVLDPTNGTSLAVTYTDGTKVAIMLGSASTPVEVMNVADPISDSDAVNYATLKSTADELRTELGAGGLKYVQVNSTGADAVAAGSDAIAIGQQAVASSDSTVAVGAGARAAAAQAVALGNGSLADAALTVSVGNSTTALQRRVVNLQAGINADHAVSVSQLQPIITALGGGAAIDPATGAVTGPTYTLTNGGNQTTVAAALSQLDAAISAGGGGGGNPYLAVNSAGTAALASGADAIGLGSSTTASANSSVAIGAGSVANVANTVSVGSASNQRKLVNVAAGDISVATSTDAVNGGQLFAVAQDVDALQDALTGSGLIDPVSKTSLAVTYSSSAQTIVMLGNAGAIAKPAASRAADAAPPVWRSRRTVR